ncbi:hypothetical protein [Aeromonas dhakensis]|uniref:hypothetical protein n=1 Tax=Aeromonas dhakensis TaxID=196024 RepID=UPI003988486E
MITVNKLIKNIMSIFSTETRRQAELRRDIFKFFLIFSRFEFSLKSSGFLNKKKNGESAEPGWDTFVKKYKLTFKIHDELQESFDYLTDPSSAPNRQILVVTAEGSADEKLSTTWKPQNIDANAPELKKVTDSIRLVRNNLFHGGKYGDKTWDDPERTKLLIEHSIKVIWALLELDSEVEGIFENFA